MYAKSCVACMLAGVLALAPLAGCANGAETGQPADDAQTEQQQPSVPQVDVDDDDIDDIDDDDAQLVGGWTVNTECTASLSEDERALFEQAMADYVGVDLEPVTVVATQLVSGTNYAYLCQATPVTVTPATSWAIAVVYQDLEGNARVTDVEDIELGDIEVADGDVDDDLDELVGGWKVRDASNVIALPAVASEAFAKAAQNYEGVALTPIELLGTQVVSGTNYLVLCQGGTATQEAEQELYVARVYEDLDGNAQFAEVAPFDLLEYV